MTLEAVHNFRDLGGHFTDSGRITRHGRVYRSAELTGATAADASFLVAHCGVRSLVDLRSGSERELFGSVEAVDADVVELPLLSDSDLAATFSFPTLAHRYADLVRSRRVVETLVEVLEFLAMEDSLPCLLFCSAGKDRTGLVVSAILGSVGVPDDAIADEYALSDEAMAALYAGWAKHPKSAIERRLRTDSHLLGAPREAMSETLALISRRWGSMRGYLAAHGATDTLFKRLEQTLLEGASAAEAPSIVPESDHDGSAPQRK